VKWLGIAAAVAGAAYVTILASLFFAQRSFLYPVPRDQIDVAVAGMERVALHTGDGLTLHAAYAPAAAGRRTLVFFHGNGDGLLGADQATMVLRRAGFGMLLVEYRGYGGNPGTVTEQGLYRDGRAALDWLAARGVAGQRIVLIGNSLGSGVASQLVTERPVGALVLVSPFTRMVDVVGKHFPYIPAGVLLRDRYDNFAKLRGRDLPLLVLHGEADTLIPAAQGRALAAAVPGSRLVLDARVGHELAYLAPTQRAILEWLAQLPPATGLTPPANPPAG
jgi:uncharacterized protein